MIDQGGWRLVCGLVACCVLVPLLSACGDDDAPAPGPKPEPPPREGAPEDFKPVPVPDPKIPGFTFPETEEVIVAWTQANDRDAVDRHGWGLWTALTLPSGQTHEGQELLVFETWLTPGDMQEGPGVAAANRRRDPRPLRVPRQFGHGGRTLALGGDDTVQGFVKYDPAAAKHVMDEGLFKKSVLDKMLADGKTAIPDFPDHAVVLKVVWRVAAAGERYYKMKAWPGPPSTFKAFPSSDWNANVWIDTEEKGAGTGTGATAKDGEPRSAATTYGLGRLIHFNLSAEQAVRLNASRVGVMGGNAGTQASAGDVALMVGMHVTSREITRWTWQTYWWTPHPDRPNFPSSPRIASLRPDQLEGAARNYAQSAGYQNLVPPQPDTGGSNTGESLYVYNPHLEAGFDSSVLPDSLDGTFEGKPVKNDVGIQTNCMSCHAQAHYGSSAKPPDYCGDRYVDLDDPAFRGVLKVDFLWSIPHFAK